MRVLIVEDNPHIAELLRDDPRVLYEYDGYALVTLASALTPAAPDFPPEYTVLSP